MKPVSLILIWIAGSIILLASCSNPAIMVMDSASDAYYQWQGRGIAGLEASANRAGYHLIVCQLKPAEPVAEQIDQAWKRNGEANAVLIYPPILSAEAVAGLSRFPAKATILLAARPADLTKEHDKLVTLDIDRNTAFQNLGGYLAVWLRKDPKLRVKAQFLVDSPARQKELDSLWRGYEQADGITANMSVQSWEQLPAAADLRNLSEGIKSDPNVVLLLFLGNADVDFAINLSDWTGHMVGEQIGSLAGDLNNIIASIDVEWDMVLQQVLEKTKGNRGSFESKMLLIADLHLYNEYLKK